MASSEILCSSCKFKMKKKQNKIENCECCFRLKVQNMKVEFASIKNLSGIEFLVGKDCLLTNRNLCLNCKRNLTKNPDKIEENEVIQLFNCGRCKVVSYCSKNCQKENHALHKNFCKAFPRVHSAQGRPLAGLHGRFSSCDNGGGRGRDRHLHHDHR